MTEIKLAASAQKPDAKVSVEYSSNNSGGSWWLDDADWYALEQHGWVVDWIVKEKSPVVGRFGSDGRWLGALAKSATRYGLDLGAAIREWEEITRQDSADLGCACCGTPHYFTETQPDGAIRSYSPEHPTTGERFED